MGLSSYAEKGSLPSWEEAHGPHYSLCLIIHLQDSCTDKPETPQETPKDFLEARPPEVPVSLCSPQQSLRSQGPRC